MDEQLKSPDAEVGVPSGQSTEDSESISTAVATVAMPPPLSARGRTAADRKRQAAKAEEAETQDSPPLTGIELSQRFELYSRALVDELHALTIRQLQAEEQREGRLDSKAQSLLITAGLSLTVAFTFGGMLLQHPEYLAAFDRNMAIGVLAAYLLALVAGLLASGVAVRALFVTDGYRSVNERELLGQDLLNADEECTDPGNPQDNAKSLTRYRRYVTVQLWQIWQSHYRLHETKATTIAWGQRSFLTFLTLMMIIGAVLAYGAFDRYDELPTIGVLR